MKKELVCIVCPRGCRLTAEIDGNTVKSVSGNSCIRGKNYAENECTNPVRTITTTVKTEDGGRLSVKTKSPIPKDKIFECMEVINSCTAKLPVKCGDVIISDILKTGSDVVATQNK